MFFKSYKYIDFRPQIFTKGAPLSIEIDAENCIALIISCILKVYLIRNVTSETAVRRCSSKWVFLKVSQYSEENTCLEVSV